MVSMTAPPVLAEAVGSTPAGPPPVAPTAEPGLEAAPDADDSDDAVTIGVAIAVPEPFATQLRDARRSYGDPQADVIPTHVTILPPTRIDATSMPAVEEHLAAVAAGTTPFRIELMGTDTFRPVSPVVFVPLVRGASACEALANRVRTGPLQRSLDFAYHPHVTVGHNISDEQLDAAEVGSRDVHLEFVADEVVLYLRDTAHNWERCAGFAFCSDAALGTSGAQDGRADKFAERGSERRTP